MNNLTNLYEKQLEKELWAKWSKQIEAFQAEQPPELPADTKLDPWDINNAA